jgi:RHS repeat-associated protein
MTVRNGANTVLSTDSYTYSPNLDYLTGATYTGTPTISGGSWTYDASGNRSNSGYSYDALNRMTASPGTTYSHDIVGNRLQSVTPAGISTVTSTYQWDALNRLTNLVRADSMIVDATDAAYTYRADGLRTSKIVDYTGALEEPNSGFYDFNYFVNNATTNYFYDGQMAVQERYTADAGSNAVNVDETRNFLGARGIDMIEAERIAGAAGDDKIGSKRKQYPIYDGHGNMICSVIRSTAGNGYSLVNEKRYDAWGAVVQTSGAGDALANPKEGYQGAIGHKYDAESDLIYMRARYYEPASGRFISQDPAGDGWNWYAYCKNDPIGYVDGDGKHAKQIVAGLFLAAFWLFFLAGVGILNQINLGFNQGAGALSTTTQKAVKEACKKSFARAFAFLAVSTGVSGWDDNWMAVVASYVADAWFVKIINTMVDGMEFGLRGQTRGVVFASAIYGFFVMKLIIEAL